MQGAKFSGSGSDKATVHHQKTSTFCLVAEMGRTPSQNSRQNFIWKMDVVFQTFIIGSSIKCWQSPLTLFTYPGRDMYRKVQEWHPSAAMINIPGMSTSTEWHGSTTSYTPLPPPPNPQLFLSLYFSVRGQRRDAFNQSGERRTEDCSNGSTNPRWARQTRGHHWGIVWV